MRYKSKYSTISDISFFFVVQFALSYSIIVFLLIAHTSFLALHPILCSITEWHLTISCLITPPALLVHIYCEFILHHRTILPGAIKYNTLLNNTIPISKLKRHDYAAKGPFNCILDNGPFRKNNVLDELTDRIYKDLIGQTPDKFIYIVSPEFYNYIDNYNCNILGIVNRDDNNNIIFDNSNEIFVYTEGYFS